jgi:hypothetical protein
MPHDTRIPREIIILLAEEFAARAALAAVKRKELV